MIPRPYVIQRGVGAFWTGHDWADAIGEALAMTMGEAERVMTREADGSPAPLNLIKDYGKPGQCVLGTA